MNNLKIQKRPHFGSLFLFQLIAMCHVVRRFLGVTKIIKRINFNIQKLSTEVVFNEFLSLFRIVR